MEEWTAKCLGRRFEGHSLSDFLIGAAHEAARRTIEQR